MPKTKTLDENWIDWENHAFGYGYGSGEPHIIPKLKQFFELCDPKDHFRYDYEILEKELSPAVAWLLINTLANDRVDMIEYGTSPRYGWLTSRGKALKAYLETKTSNELTDLVCQGKPEGHIPCYPDACNCGPNGYIEGRHCPNPFWNKYPWRK